MENEGKRREEISKGLKAARFANDQVFIDAVAGAKEEYIREFTSSPMDDSGDLVRRNARQGLDALQLLVSRLTKVVGTGQEAQAQIAQFEEQKLRKLGPTERNLHRVA